MSKIEWTEKTWNPIVGCSVVSPGCKNCYAMTMARRLAAMGVDRYAGLTKTVNGNVVWTGELRQAPEDTLLEPLRRKKPTMWFVNSMSDLFHESVPDDRIDRVFAVMALCPQHTFQVLTKRSARMLAYFTAHRRAAPSFEKRTTGPTPVQRIQALICDYVRLGRFEAQGYGPVYPEDLDRARDRLRPLPLPNVWLGVSCEDQRRADERIPDLLATPAAVRFVSAEPLLGAIDFEAVKFTAAPGFFGSALRWHHRGYCHEREGLRYSALDWVIVGGESGPGARPMHPDWARDIRDQCVAAGVPFFFKQWGAWGDCTHIDLAVARSGEDRIFTASGRVLGGGHPKYGGGVDPDWKEQGAAWMRCLGKKAAGRLLDGREWNEMPARATEAQAVPT